MPNISTYDIANMVIDKLSAVKNETLSARMSDYMKGHFKFFGVASPDRKLIQNTFHQTVKSMDMDNLLDLGSQLWSHPMRECQYVAIDFLTARKRHLALHHLAEIEHYITHKSWWDSVDALASHLVGQILSDHTYKRLEIVERYSNSSNLWLIRTAIIHQLKYGKAVDLDILFVLITDHCESDEFFIRKASGWALRQASKFYPNEVKTYIDSHEAILSRLTIKEGSKYL